MCVVVRRSRHFGVPDLGALPAWQPITHCGPLGRRLSCAADGVRPPTFEGFMLLQDSPDSLTQFDGTPGAILSFMREMVELTGQGRAGMTPVLELQFDHVVTFTSLNAEPPRPELCIVVHLPRDAGSQYVSPLHQVVPLAAGGELLWDAGEGRYVMLETVSIDRLTDECSLFDAVLDAKDRALDWLACGRRVN